MLWVRIVWLPLHAHKSVGKDHLNETTAVVAAQPVSFHAVTTSAYSGPIELFDLLEYSSTDTFFKYIAFTALRDLVHEGWNDPGAILLPSPGSAAGSCPLPGFLAPCTGYGSGTPGSPPEQTHCH